MSIRFVMRAKARSVSVIVVLQSSDVPSIQISHFLMRQGEIMSNTDQQQQVQFSELPAGTGQCAVFNGQGFDPLAAVIEFVTHHNSLYRARSPSDGAWCVRTGPPFL